MDIAAKILVAYGTIALAYGFVLGFPMAATRRKAPVAPRNLVTVHLSGLMQGPIHLGLAGAFSMTGFDGAAATTAAVLLVAGSALELIGGTTNWLTRTGDQFAERSPGYLLNAVSGPVNVAGMLVAAVGILTNL